MQWGEDIFVVEVEGNVPVEKWVGKADIDNLICFDGGG